MAVEDHVTGEWMLPNIPQDANENLKLYLKELERLFIHLLNPVKDFSEITLETDLDILHGGTGESTAQDAIDAISQVSGGTNEYVLTKDTTSGSAEWKIVGIGSIAWTNAIASAILIVDKDNDGANIDVGGINTIFVDIVPDSVVIDNFQNGVAGQILRIVIRTVGEATKTLTINDQSGSNQEIYLHDTGSNLVIGAADRGGVNLICDGTNWYDISHAKHV